MIKKYICTIAEPKAGATESHAQKGAQDTPSPVNACDVAVQCVITDGVTADCTKAGEFIAKSCFEFRRRTPFNLLIQTEQRQKWIRVFVLTLRFFRWLQKCSIGFKRASAEAGRLQPAFPIAFRTLLCMWALSIITI